MADAETLRRVAFARNYKRRQPDASWPYAYAQGTYGKVLRKAFALGTVAAAVADNRPEEVSMAAAQRAASAAFHAVPGLREQS